MIGIATTRCIAFEGTVEIARGDLRDIILTIKSVIDNGARLPVWTFEQDTSETVEFDVRGSDEDVLQRLDAATRWAASHSMQASSGYAEVATQTAAPDGHRGPGRPKLGVVPREITLLPRHWEWLNHQPGGASVAIRKLVEAARKSTEPANQIRMAQERAYRFMLTMAGDLVNFEEGMRAFFGGDEARFQELSAEWPADVRRHALELSAKAFQPAVAE